MTTASNPNAGPPIHTSPPGERPIELPSGRIIRAHELLSAQPISLIGMSAEERRKVVVTAITDSLGREHVVSRIGDPIWDLHSLWLTQNRKRSDKVARWTRGIPPEMLDDAQSVLYLWHKRGRTGARVPGGRSLIEAVKGSGPILRHFGSIGIKNFGDVRRIHISDYAAGLPADLSCTAARKRLEILDLLWYFRAEMLHPLQESPWGEKTLAEICGYFERGGYDKGVAGKRGKTPVIPPSVQSALFNTAESIVSSEKATAPEKRRSANRKNTSLRDAVLYLLQISSGMRNSEATGVKSGSWRTEIKNDVAFHWVSTVEYKTLKGHVEFLVPPETLEALTLLEAQVRPLQERLRREVVTLKELLASSDADVLSNGMTRVAVLQRIKVAEDSADNLFLAQDLKDKDVNGENRVEVMSDAACRFSLIRLGKRAGVKWDISNHQCRRTFAWAVANSRLGRIALIFLKWQFKHSSMNMTQLYAANPNQDPALYDEFYEEIVSAQAEVLASWFEGNDGLSGGAGRKIEQVRAIKIKDRESLLRHTAETVTIRSTGHSWCLSEDGTCVGGGIHEAIRCGDCSSGVIDQHFVQTWQHIHLHNVELTKVLDCGPAVIQRAHRDVKVSEKVLAELGVPVPNESHLRKTEHVG